MTDITTEAGGKLSAWCVQHSCVFITDKHSCTDFTGDLLKPDGVTLISRFLVFLPPPHTPPHLSPSSL